MKPSRRVAGRRWGWVFTAIIIILGLSEAYMGGLIDNYLPGDDPHWTSALAAKDDTLVAMAKVVPPDIVFEGKTISINEAWIERQVKTTHPFTWLSPRGGTDYLCFTVRDGLKFFSDGNSLTFFSNDLQNDGRVRYVTSGIRVVFFAEIQPDALAKRHIQLGVVKAYGEPRVPVAAITW